MPRDNTRVAMREFLEAFADFADDPAPPTPSAIDLVRRGRARIRRELDAQGPQRALPPSRPSESKPPQLRLFIKGRAPKQVGDADG